MKKQYYILLNLDKNNIRSEFAGFYVNDIHKKIPEDAIPITEKEWKEYHHKMSIDGLLLWVDGSNNIKTRPRFSKWDNTNKLFVLDDEKITKNGQQLLIRQAKQAFKYADLGRYHFDKLTKLQQKTLNDYLDSLNDIITGKVYPLEIPPLPDFLR